MMSRILIIEDDVSVLNGLKDAFTFEEYDVLTAVDGEHGYRLLAGERPDLVVLDLMLPKMNGYELCRRARESGIEIPIIMLTARGEEMDRVLGLDLGADDYVSKPFSIAELLARVRAALRRRGADTALPGILRFADVNVDFERYEAAKDGSEVAMSPKEFGVLRFLAAREGKAVTREDLLENVWGYDHFPTTRTVDNHVASLRGKLEDDPSNPRFILTVHGVGYKFNGASKSR